MSNTLTPDVLNSIKEIIRISNELRTERATLRNLEHERDVHRTTVLNHYHGSVKLVTPLGNVVIKDREYNSKFSLEEIRDIFTNLDSIPDNYKQILLTVLEQEADKKHTTTRTLTVQRQQTLKNKKHRKHKSKAKTLKQAIK